MKWEIGHEKTDEDIGTRSSWQMEGIDFEIRAESEFIVSHMLKTFKVTAAFIDNRSNERRAHLPYPHI